MKIRGDHQSTSLKNYETKVSRNNSKNSYNNQWNNNDNNIIIKVKIIKNNKLFLSK